MKNRPSPPDSDSHVKKSVPASGLQGMTEHLEPGRVSGLREPSRPVLLKADFPGRASRRRSRRVVRTDTISGIYYRIARQRMKRRAAWYTGIFLVLLVFAVLGIGFFAVNRAKTAQILHWVSNGLEMLRFDQVDEAEASFDQALAVYRHYHVWYPDLWWKSDALVFHAMLRAAQGYRSLGLYQKGLDVFQVVALHNTRGLHTWVGRMMKEGLDEFVDESHWSLRDMNAIYEILLQTPPAYWGASEALVVHATEKVGLVVWPMRERFRTLRAVMSWTPGPKNYAWFFERAVTETGVVIYGTPQPMEPGDVYCMVDGMRFYFVEHLPGPVPLFFAPMPESHLARLQWYCRTNQPCLIFGIMRDFQFFLTRIDGILLCEPGTVEQFNHHFPKNLW